MFRRRAEDDGWIAGGVGAGVLFDDRAHLVAEAFDPSVVGPLCLKEWFDLSVRIGQKQEAEEVGFHGSFETLTLTSFWAALALIRMRESCQPSSSLFKKERVPLSVIRPA